MTANEFRFSGAVDHIAIRCEDLDRAVAGYAQLGFSVETIYDDWALMRDRNGFGIALLPPNSKHPPHIGIKVETLAELHAAATKENRPIKEHRDKTSSFYTKGVGDQIIELIYYPPDYDAKG